MAPIAQSRVLPLWTFGRFIEMRLEAKISSGAHCITAKTRSCATLAGCSAITELSMVMFIILSRTKVSTAWLIHVIGAAIPQSSTKAAYLTTTWTPS